MADANSDGVARMLDSLMDRVDRLENSGESEAAIATFIEASERAASRDEGEVLGPELNEAAVSRDDAEIVVDVEMRDAGVATDDASSVQGRVVARLRWNERTWNTSTWSGDDVDAIEPATGEDTGVATDDGAVQGRDVESLVWNSRTWNTSTWS